MRLLVLAAGLAASVALSACSQSSSEAQETAPVKPKDLGRSRMYYQGQDMIVKVDQATIETGKAGDGIVLKASGVAAGPGYTDAQFLPRIYPAPPADGIYEVDVVATKPAAGAAAATPIEVKGDWTYYPKEHLKGVRFMSKTNAVVANLPASPPASGK